MPLMWLFWRLACSENAHYVKYAPLLVAAAILKIAYIINIYRKRELLYPSRNIKGKWLSETMATFLFAKIWPSAHKLLALYITNQ